MSTKSHSSQLSGASNSIDLRFRTEEYDFGAKTVDLDSFRPKAVQWCYVVANRRRWSRSKAEAEQMFSRCRDQLQEIGLTEDELKRMAKARFVEVGIPFTSEDVGWEARVFPWEYVIAAATKPWRTAHALTVVRHLDAGAGVTPRSIGPPKSVLFVASAPAPLDDFYGFKVECQVVKDAMDLKDFKALTNPTQSAFTADVKGKDWDVVYLTGLDIHQAVELLEEHDVEKGDPLVMAYDTHERHDGLVILNDTGELDYMESLPIANALSARANKPMLLTMNLYHSAGRMAALAVSQGVGAAIGFQDTFDDDLTDDFFAILYQGWKDAEWDLLPAFAQALESLPPSSSMGTGVVLWSATSLVGPTPRISPSVMNQRMRSRMQILKEVAPPQIDAKPSPKPKSRSGGLKSTGHGGQVTDVNADVIPVKSLNYSMLHNGRGLFQTFKISPVGDPAGRVFVLVDLYLGGMSTPYRQTIRFQGKPALLHEDIKIPLASTLLRTLKEPLRTTMLVQISSDPDPAKPYLLQETYAVTLLPVNEWRDSGMERQWLPSFLQPGDPAVGRIIRKAQKFLMAIEDDWSIGFDGYQCINPADNDVEGVDAQVQAIWSAILHDFHLHYINPPPAYGVESQRLRTPTDVVDAGRGTCIDLALLFAACLELAGIYPVLFLTKGHCFAGYWRADFFHQEFRTGINPQTEVINSTPGIKRSSNTPWMIGDHQEAWGAVSAGKLIPLETTRLTDRGSFGAAMDEGIENVRNAAQFESLIDVRLARTDETFPITPIPLGGN